MRMLCCSVFDVGVFLLCLCVVRLCASVLMSRVGSKRLRLDSYDVGDQAAQVNNEKQGMHASKNRAATHATDTTSQTTPADARTTHAWQSMLCVPVEPHVCICQCTFASSQVRSIPLHRSLCLHRRVSLQLPLPFDELIPCHRHGC